MPACFQFIFACLSLFLLSISLSRVVLSLSSSLTWAEESIGLYFPWYLQYIQLHQRQRQCTGARLLLCLADMTHTHTVSFQWLDGNTAAHTHCLILNANSQYLVSYSYKQTIYFSSHRDMWLAAAAACLQASLSRESWFNATSCTGQRCGVTYMTASVSAELYLIVHNFYMCDLFIAHRKNAKPQ